MSRYKRRVDSNQLEVVNKLRELGFSVALTHVVGGGFPDFIVGFYGVNYMVELKFNNGKMTTDEIDFFSSWGGQVGKHYNVEQILNGLLEYICYLDGFFVSSKQIILVDIIKNI